MFSPSIKHAEAVKYTVKAGNFVFGIITLFVKFHNASDFVKASRFDAFSPGFVKMARTRPRDPTCIFLILCYSVSVL